MFKKGKGHGDFLQTTLGKPIRRDALSAAEQWCVQTLLWDNCLKA